MKEPKRPNVTDKKGVAAKRICRGAGYELANTLVRNLYVAPSRKRGRESLYVTSATASGIKAVDERCNAMNAVLVLAANFHIR